MPTNKFEARYKNKKMSCDIFLLRCLGGRWDWLRHKCRFTPFPSARRGGTSKLLRKKLLRSPLLFSIPMPTNKFEARYKKQKDVLRHLLASLFGWKMGFEPTTLGTTILYSNQLSYIHHLICFQIGVQIYTLFLYLQNFRA